MLRGQKGILGTEPNKVTQEAQGKAGLESLKGVYNGLCCIFAGWLWLGYGCGSHLFFCVWGSEEGVSEGKQKLILESKKRWLRTQSQWLESTAYVLDRSRMRESKGARWVEWGRAGISYSCRPEVWREAAEKRLQQEITFKEATPIWETRGASL